METDVTNGGGKVPDKLFYKATEVCQITDTQPYVLRFWESEFPQLASEKNRSGQRVYRKQDIDLILRIKKLLYEEEYTIAGARKFLDQEPSAGAHVGPQKTRGKRAETAQPHSRDDRASERSSLFGESRPEAPATAPSTDAERYQALYEEALQTIATLKGEAETASSTRDHLRERHRRVLSGLETALET